MAPTTSQCILDKIDGIANAVGQKDFDALCVAAQKASVLTSNLAKWFEVLGRMKRADLNRLVDQLPLEKQETVLRQLGDLERYLPVFGATLIAVAKIFPQPRGGRPPSFEDRDTKRQACAQVLKFIEQGCSEPEAKRQTAKHFKVGPRTMNRAWEQRVELQNEPSFGEVFEQFLKSLSTQSNLEGRSGEPANAQLPES